MYNKIARNDHTQWITRIGIVVVLTLSLLRHAQGETLTVKVTGAHSRRGRIRVGLWNTPAGFPSDRSLRFVYMDCSALTNGVVVAEFGDLPQGEYAVAVMHDENGNGKLDTNFLGIPKEGWAVSNNVVPAMRAPRYDEAKFQLREPRMELTIALHY